MRSKKSEHAKWATTSLRYLVVACVQVPVGKFENVWSSKKKGVLYGNQVKIWLTQSFSVYQLLLLPSFNFFSSCKSNFLSSCFWRSFDYYHRKKIVYYNRVKLWSIHSFGVWQLFIFPAVNPYPDEVVFASPFYCYRNIYTLHAIIKSSCGRYNRFVCCSCRCRQVYFF